MGEGTNRVRELAREIDELREEMTPLLRELDQRRTNALDLRLQARRHLVPVTLAALGVAGLTGYSVWSWIHERHERRRPVVRARRLRRAVSRMIDEPERVAAGDPSGMRAIGIAIARAAATAAASLAARRAVERFAAASRARAVPAVAT